MKPHQYIDRRTGAVFDEHLIADAWIRFLYHPVREQAPALFDLFTSPVASRVLAWPFFDARPFSSPAQVPAFMRTMGADPSECLDPLFCFKTKREVFERKIRYETCRHMADMQDQVVSPADSRVITGSLEDCHYLPIKEKQFDFDALLGKDRWTQLFSRGEMAIFRLTPDKYHYSHAPVSGILKDRYRIDGPHHSCNPSAVIALASPYTRNLRWVSVIDTDVDGGTGVGMVAMIEVAALMIGGLTECYSTAGYDNPIPLTPGLFIEKGAPISLYRPGSSTDILLFEPGRIRFSEDLEKNRMRTDVRSRYSIRLERPAVETDIRLRSPIAHATDSTCS